MSGSSRLVSSLPSLLPSLALAGLSLCVASLTTGCGIGTVDNSLAPQTVATAISGELRGGDQPISGSTVQLWETGTTGYGTGAAQLVAQTTTAIGTGAFAFPTSNIPANCTGGPYAYITASGGDPTGNTLTASNHAILLAAVLGGCSSVGANTHVTINEVTTVAAAYALSGFSAVTGAAGSLASLNVGAPSTNAQGLADAVSNAILLANPNFGSANASSATVELPTAALNSIANTLSACTNATEYNAAPCTTVLPLATPPGGTQPTNIFQAALNIARFPGNNVSALLNAGTATPAFAPTLPGNGLNDLSLGIAYLNSTQSGAKTTPVGIAIDNTDNVWILGGASSADNYITEQLSSSAGGTVTNTLSSLVAADTLRNGAFDTNGNLWITLKSSTAGGVVEVPSGSVSAATAYPYALNDGAGATLDANTYSLAIDASNNIFTASYGAQGNCIANTATTGTTVCDIVEFPAGSPGSPTNLFGGTQASAPTIRDMAVDTTSTAGKGNVWAVNYGNIGGGSTAPASYGYAVTVLTPSTGATSTITLGSSSSESEPWGVALDKSGGAYITADAIAGSPTFGTLFYIPQGTATSSITNTVSTSGTATTLANILNTTSAPANTATTAAPLGGLNTPGQAMVDGAGNVWIGNANAGTIAEYSPSLQGYLSPFYGFAPSIATTAAPTNQATFACTGTTTITCAITGLANKKSLVSMAIDRAGSVWSMDSAGTLVEILGTAAPTMPVLSKGGVGSLP